MSWLYRHAIRPLLFQLNPEYAHDLMQKNLAWASRSSLAAHLIESLFGAPDLPVDLFGLRFPNPLGIAAGLDKQATAVPIWRKLGFGFCEIGGVTWQSQPGNPPPRMFRIPKDEAIINRMGFNNPGAEAIAGSLTSLKRAGRWPKYPVGINLGKSKSTPPEGAAEDYARSFKALRESGDFFVVNVSSPNTPGLRDLQQKQALDEILKAIQQAQKIDSGSTGGSFIGLDKERPSESPKLKPVLVKISPDLPLPALDDILELAESRNLAGIVATNTTMIRPGGTGGAKSPVYSEAGGLSGRPLQRRSTEIIRHIYKVTGGRLPIVGVGGIFNADDAWEKVEAGASLLQVYTGLVYEGPGIARNLMKGMQEKLAAKGIKCWSDAVGYQH